jgi:glycosyltransferase involved in cell wall biosynthesis
VKILFALTYYRPHVSGVTVYVQRLAEALAARGHQVTVLTSRYDRSLPREEIVHQVSVARRLFAIPARVTWHARRMRIEFLGVSAAIRSQFERWHLCISRC